MEVEQSTANVKLEGIKGRFFEAGSEMPRRYYKRSGSFPAKGCDACFPYNLQDALLMAHVFFFSLQKEVTLLLDLLNALKGARGRERERMGRLAGC